MLIGCSTMPRADQPREEQLLAARVLMEIWQGEGRDAALLSLIQERMNDQPALKAVCDLWLAPRELSEEERQYQEEHARMRRERDAREDDRDRSWQEFLTKLRADPDILNRQPAPTRDHIDHHLYHLWILLRSSDQGGNRYGVDDLRPVQPMLRSPADECISQGADSILAPMDTDPAEREAGGQTQYHKQH